MAAGTEPLYAGWRLRLTRPTGPCHRLTHRRPGKRSAAGRWQRVRSRFLPAGWRLAPYPTCGPRHLSTLSPPGRGRDSGASAVQSRHLLRAQAQRRRAGKTFHRATLVALAIGAVTPSRPISHARATSAGFAPCSSATATRVSIIRIPRGFRYLPIPLRAGSAPDPTADGTYRLRIPRPGCSRSPPRYRG